MNLLVHNPNSSNANSAGYWRRALLRVGVETLLHEGAELQTLPDLGKEDCLIVVGGDGTVRRYADWCSARGCTLGVLPAGTGNDFARGIGVPLDPNASCAVIRDGTKTDIDVATVNRNTFMNVAHIGLGSEISRTVDHNIKQSWGRLAYLRTLLHRISEMRGFRATIHCGDETVHGRWLQITIANGRSFGGGQEFFGASPFDGELDLLAVRPRPVAQLITVWLRAHLKGTPPESPAIVHRRGTVFEIGGNSGLKVVGDGDTLTTIPARFGIRPGALRVILPPAETAS